MMETFNSLLEDTTTQKGFAGVVISIMGFITYQVKSFIILLVNPHSDFSELVANKIILYGSAIAMILGILLTLTSLVYKIKEINKINKELKRLDNNDQLKEK